MMLKQISGSVSVYLKVAVNAEAIPYLDKAMKAGVQEAYLLQQITDIAMEQKKNAIQVLKNYKVKYPQEGEVADRLIQEN